MGKGLNPAEQFRKEQKKKEIKKSKNEQKELHKIQALLNDPRKIQEEIDKLEKQSQENKLDKSIKDKIKEYQTMKNVALKKEQIRLEAEKLRNPLLKMSDLKSKSQDDDSSAIRDITESIYYHPAYNPLAIPPPGKSQEYNVKIDDTIPPTTSSSSSSSSYITPSLPFVTNIPNPLYASTPPPTLTPIYPIPTISPYSHLYQSHHPQVVLPPPHSHSLPIGGQYGIPLPPPPRPPNLMSISHPSGGSSNIPPPPPLPTSLQISQQQQQQQHILSSSNTIPSTTTTTTSTTSSNLNSNQMYRLDEKGSSSYINTSNITTTVNSATHSSSATPILHGKDRLQSTIQRRNQSQVIDPLDPTNKHYTERFQTQFLHPDMNKISSKLLSNSSSVPPTIPAEVPNTGVYVNDLSSQQVSIEAVTVQETEYIDRNTINNNLDDVSNEGDDSVVDEEYDSVVELSAEELEEQRLIELRLQQHLQQSSHIATNTNINTNTNSDVFSSNDMNQAASSSSSSSIRDASIMMRETEDVIETTTPLSPPLLSPILPSTVPSIQSPTLIITNTNPAIPPMNVPVVNNNNNMLSMAELIMRRRHMIVDDSAPTVTLPDGPTLPPMTEPSIPYSLPNDSSMTSTTAVVVEVSEKKNQKEAKKKEDNNVKNAMSSLLAYSDDDDDDDDDDDESDNDDDDNDNDNDNSDDSVGHPNENIVRNNTTLNMDDNISPKPSDSSMMISFDYPFTSSLPVESIMAPLSYHTVSTVDSYNTSSTQVTSPTIIPQRPPLPSTNIMMTSMPSIFTRPPPPPPPLPLPIGNNTTTTTNTSTTTTSNDTTTIAGSKKGKVLKVIRPDTGLTAFLPTSLRVKRKTPADSSNNSSTVTGGSNDGNISNTVKEVSSTEPSPHINKIIKTEVSITHSLSTQSESQPYSIPNINTTTTISGSSGNNNNDDAYEAFLHEINQL